MMSRTHITVGTTCALLVSNPTSTGCCLAIMGGALGGIMPDIDVLDNDDPRTHDAIKGQITSAGLIIVCFIIDYFLKLNILNEILNSKINLIMGIVTLVILYIVGIPQKHRGFTHSFLALIIYSIPIALIYQPLLMAYIVGFLSHLLIDLLNKKGEQLLFPLKNGICLYLCSANGIVSKILMWAGLAATIVLIINAFVFHIPIIQGLDL